VNDTSNVKRFARWEDVCRTAFLDLAESNWIDEVQRLKAKSGDGGNKLRTYALFKSTWGFEPYLSIITNHKQRYLLTKFRLGICPLRIETGRHRKIPVCDRLCEFCDLGIEDELHFLLVCPLYSDLRSSFLLLIRKLICLDLGIEEGNRTIQDVKSLFVWIMRCINPDLIKALANFLSNAFALRELKLTNPTFQNSVDR
jgi:hypothetical protein